MLVNVRELASRVPVQNAKFLDFPRKEGLVSEAQLPLSHRV